MIDPEKDTVKVTRKEYKELMKEWASTDELSDEYEKVKFYKDGMPEAWRNTDGSAVAGATQSGTGVWEKIEDRGVNEDNWIETLATILSIRTMLSKRESETYILTEQLGYGRKQAAKDMGVSTGNLDGKRGDIKEKIEKAEKTAELSI